MWLELDKIYYEEELARRSIPQTQLFLKARLMKEIVEFNMPYLKLVTLETLIIILFEWSYKITHSREILQKRMLWTTFEKMMDR